jgi:DHA1 family bicyclomycin/chloramphenicol resistance-like MFS transporter
VSRAAGSIAAGQSRVGDWGFILLLGFASGLSSFGMASVVPALPELGHALGANSAQLQFIISGYLLGLGVFQPLQGLLCDRFCRRPVLLVGFSIFVAASLIASSAHSLLALTAARVLQALGARVATVISRAMVRDTHTPQDAAVALSFITAVMGIAPIIAPMAGGLAVDAAGWQAVFMLHAAMGAALLLFMLLRLRETRPAATQAMTVGELFQGFGVLLRERTFIGHSLTYAFVSGATFMFLPIGAALFARLFGMTPSRFGVFWATLAGGYTLGAVSAGWSARRFGATRVIRTAMQIGIVASIGVVATSLLTSPGLVLWSLWLTLLIFASGLSSPLALAGAVSQRADLAGVASGLSSSLAMLLSMLCAAAGGFVYHGNPTPNAILMLVCSIAAWLTARMAARSAT